MHLEKLSGAWYVIDNKTLKQLAGPFYVKASAEAEMKKIAANGRRYLI